MKNYFKKFSIMIVMLLAIIGVGSIQNGTVANAATVGQELNAPESGWKRYDDRDEYLKYTTPIRQEYSGYMNTLSYTGKGNLTFKFKGTKIMIGTLKHSQHAGYQISIDDVKYPDVPTYSSSTQYQIITFIKTNLTDDIHSVTISNMSTVFFALDFIDIDSTGYLVNPNESIALDKISLDLTKDNSKQLTATTTPAGAEVVWSSSGSTIATVDSTGKVTAVKEGQATITAQIKGSETKATCTVTVTKGGITTPTEPTNPTEPTEPTVNGNLYIEMVDGNVKQAQNIDVADFIKWFKNRDLDDNDNPIYKIKNAKEKVEYLVHDKVVAFEIR
jgi:uncharacterized protein YjdB